MSDPVSTQGFYQVGTGNDIGRLDGINPLWRIWVGNSDPALASFAVRKDGFVRMSSACITGGITVDSGSLSAIRVVSDLIPEHSGSHNLGDSASRWRELFIETGNFSGSVTTGSLSISRVKSNYIPENSGIHNLGDSGSKWNEIHAVTGCFSGSVNIDGNLYTGSLLTVGADYVFEKGYNLFPLENLSNYLTSHNTLPTMDGVNRSLNDLVLAMWETIETQALYIAELHSRVKKIEGD